MCIYIYVYIYIYIYMYIYIYIYTHIQFRLIKVALPGGGGLAAAALVSHEGWYRALLSFGGLRLRRASTCLTELSCLSEGFDFGGLRLVLQSSLVFRRASTEAGVAWSRRKNIRKTRELANHCAALVC